jgi:hypothetical protein
MDCNCLGGLHRLGCLLGGDPRAHHGGTIAGTLGLAEKKDGGTIAGTTLGPTLGPTLGFADGTGTTLGRYTLGSAGGTGTTLGPGADEGGTDEGTGTTLGPGADEGCTGKGRRDRLRGGTDGGRAEECRTGEAAFGTDDAGRAFGRGDFGCVGPLAIDTLDIALGAWPIHRIRCRKCGNPGYDGALRFFGFEFGRCLLGTTRFDLMCGVSTMASS